ncbi:MAG: hypothetical protein MUF64_17645 [Polyangiaceae bacterium]|nr:hypothetical protein [Polyangiaceae bacterium]
MSLGISFWRVFPVGVPPCGVDAIAWANCLVFGPWLPSSRKERGSPGLGGKTSTPAEQEPLLPGKSAAPIWLRHPICSTSLTSALRVVVYLLRLPALSLMLPERSSTT